MKYLLVYWIMGCLVVGVATGSAMKACPKDDILPANVVMAISIWPAFFFAGITAGKIESSGCRVKDS